MAPRSCSRPVLALPAASSSPPAPAPGREPITGHLAVWRLLTRPSALRRIRPPSSSRPRTRHRSCSLPGCSPPSHPWSVRLMPLFLWTIWPALCNRGPCQVVERQRANTTRQKAAGKVVRTSPPPLPLVATIPPALAPSAPGSIVGAQNSGRRSGARSPQHTPVLFCAAPPWGYGPLASVMDACVDRRAFASIGLMGRRP